MKRVVLSVVMVACLIMSGCGGGAAEEPEEVKQTTAPPITETTPQPTPPQEQVQTPTPTPTSTLTPTPTPTKEPIVGGDKDEHGCIGSAGYIWCEAKQKCLRPWEEECEPEVSTPTPSPTTPTPTPTPPPTPTPAQDPNSVEVALEENLPHLVVVFGKVGDKWQGYKGPIALSLENFGQSNGYWMYAAKDMAPDWLPIPLYKGWNMLAWVSPTSTVASALKDYNDTIPFVVGFDNLSKKYLLYQSPDVSPLSTLQPGQTYNSFTDAPAWDSWVWETPED